MRLSHLVSSPGPLAVCRLLQLVAAPVVVGASRAPPPCAAALGAVVPRAVGNVQCVATSLWRALDFADELLLDTAVRTSCIVVVA